MVDGSGSQVPSETVSGFPTTLVPETAGVTVATGALVTCSVEAVKRVEVPEELVAMTRATTYLPKYELSDIALVSAVDERTETHPSACSAESLST
jgi:hypothetical protein